MGEAAVFTIGQLARAAGVNVETIRYYQRKGLLEVPERPVSGYRRYPQAALIQVRFIKCAQAVGFSLREIKELHALGQGRCREIQALTERKLIELDRRLAEIRSMRGMLALLAARCGENLDEKERCALLEALMKGCLE